MSRRGTMASQCRLKRSLRSFPETIFASDNLVDRAGPTRASACTFKAAVWEATVLVSRRLTAFARFFRESTTVPDESTEAYNCGGDGLTGSELVVSSGGGTIVG
jgi:hypothetical protein